MNIIDLSVHELREKIKNKEVTAQEITKAYIDRIMIKKKMWKHLLHFLKKNL